MLNNCNFAGSDKRAADEGESVKMTAPSGENAGTRPAEAVLTADSTLTTLSNWQRMRHWVAAHAVDDFYQGLIPAAIPYFVLQHHFSYTQASGLVFASTIGASLPQPLFGVVADRRNTSMMAPAGIAVAGICAGTAGLVSTYWLIWLLLFFSGIGVAAFHPAAGRQARIDAGDSATAMSLFAAGGSIGFFLAPALATPALVHMGVGAMAWFIPPAILMAFILLRRAPRTPGGGVAASSSRRDRWWMFAALTGVEVVRSVMFFGMNTFLALYWIRHLGASPQIAGFALTAFLVGGVAGTLLGGRIGDQFGMVRTVQTGAIIAIPAYLALRWCPSPTAGLALAALAGVATNMPFSVLIKLGQDYLPTRPGTASGVTLGLAVSIGGLFVPALGIIADHSGPQGVLSALCAVPIAAIILGFALREPSELRD